MALIGVSPNGNRWQVTREGEIVSVHLDREAAMEAARELASGDHGRVSVVDESADTTAVIVDQPDAAPARREGRTGTDVPEPNEVR